MGKRWRKVLPLAAVLLAMNSSIAVASADQSELIKRGEYLAIAGDCGACHSDEGKAAFSGGHPIVSPLGTIYSTNITPSLSAGIGNYTEQQFADALRKGVRGDGSQLYPAMPYTAYATLTDEDVSALYAYFMHGVKAVDTHPQATALPFPFNLRFSMAAWNLLFLNEKPFTPDSAHSAEWNRGAYLVNGLAHCSTCHTPRNFLMAEKQDQALSGASLGTWYAPNITPDSQHGIGNWSRQMLAEYLMTGHTSNGATAGGPMLEAIDKSFSRMTPEDINAMAAYLLPDDKQHGTAPSPEGLTPVRGDDTPQALSKLSRGESIYRNNCASCHNLSGTGLNGLPALAGNPVLDKPNADNVAMAILDGVWPEHRQGMIGFRHELNDSQIADVTNYLMSDIAHRNVQISAERVAELRQGGATSQLLLMARGGMIAGAVVVVILLMWLLWRRRHQ